MQLKKFQKENVFVLYLRIGQQARLFRHNQNERYQENFAVTSVQIKGDKNFPKLGNVSTWISIAGKSNLRLPKQFHSKKQDGSDCSIQSHRVSWNQNCLLCDWKQFFNTKVIKSKASKHLNLRWLHNRNFVCARATDSPRPRESDESGPIQER